MQEEQNKAQEKAVRPNRIVSIFRTLRNNWKKSTFGLVLLGFGYNYASDQYRTRQFMRVYCEEAKKYGDQIIPVSVKPRHVTVILNPAAKNGKGKKLYEKFSSPLLHLAGIKVSVIQTEQEGQARNLMEIMDNTDAVVIAGGDGTLHEAVTGLLRREDEGCKRLPLGLAPIGKQNLSAKNLFSDPGMTETRLLAESTMAVIRELHQPVDVIRVEGHSGKPVYAVKSLECGAFRDADTVIDKYWYFGALKAKVSYLMSAIKGPSENLSLEMSYVLPCPGCSSCYHPVTKSTEDEKSRSGNRWWHAFIPRGGSSCKTDVSSGPDYSQVINENCGLVYHKNISCSNILFTLHNDKGVKAIKGDIEDPLTGRLKFLRDGWTRYSSNGKLPDQSLQFRQADIIFESKENEERWFSIDNEKYEMQNARVSLLPSKVHMYIKRN